MYCICSPVCERFGGGRGWLLCYYPAAAEEGRGQQAVCLCLSVSKPISPNREARKEGVTWQNHRYYEIVGVHFNSTWPCQGHHMPACLPACQAYWRHGATGQRQLLHKDTPSNYFQWQHTIWWPSWRVKLHDCNTSSLRGNSSHRPHQKNTINDTDSYDKERNIKFKCACREKSVEQWMCLSVISVGLLLRVWPHCSRPQKHK